MFLKKHSRINPYEKIDIKDVLLNREELNNHAIHIAKEHVVSKKPERIGSILARLNNNFKIIEDVYRSLNEELKMENDLSPASEWLLDNYYKIEEQVQVIEKDFIKNKFFRLPMIKGGFLKGFPRVYALVLELVAHTDGRVDEEILVEFVKKYQTHKILSIGEIWSLSLMIRFALVEVIRNVSEKIYENQSEWKNVKVLESKNEEILFNEIKRALDEMNEVSPSYIEHLLKSLRRRGIDSVEIIEYMDKKLIEFDTSIDKIIDFEHKEQAARKISIGNAIVSLNKVSKLNWDDLFESISVVDEILREDPVDIYSKMDFETRNHYRYHIEKIARKCEVSETKVARKVVEYAKGESGEQEKLKHIGYYILDEGREKIFREFGCQKTRYTLHDYKASTYIGPIVLLTLAIGLILSMYAYNDSLSIGLGLLVFICTIIPASDIAVTFVNFIITHTVEPSFLPKLEYKDGITEDATTLVVIPTLVANEKNVDDLLENLEVHYLGNKDKNLYFALAGDFKDSDNEMQPQDDMIIDKALSKIKELNEKYGDGEERFFYFHRSRQFCEEQQKWMGWERKRGALVELNELLTGSKDTSYSIVSGDVSNLVEKVKYVITLDADTKLPIDTARRLVGTISHPLNRAVMDEERGVVVEGYGLIQPRIGLDIEDANKSMFTRIFAGQGGIDTYTTAISDVYQDLFSEGIFTGKGIYDLHVFHEIFKDAIPDHTVLSHDLLEGSYIRTGLTTDIELIDGYPSKYSSFIMRLHRWVRGDWQIIRWLSSSIKNRMGKKVKNPLSTLSKWKIIDNLRRSLVSISLLLFFVLGLTIFPGKIYVWVGFGILTIGFPLIMACVNYILHKQYKGAGEKTNGNQMVGIKAIFYQVLLLFIFLPYQAYMMGDAIIRTLYRVYISKKNLLEWVTAADAERRLKNDIYSFAKRMRASAWIGMILCLLAGLYERTHLLYAIPIGLIWALSFFVAYRVSKEEKVERKLTDEDVQILRRLARKTWAYYEDFAGEKENYLPVDNFQEDPPNGIAYRTSPTNIGFLLLSILSARDFGYISTTQMIKRINETIGTIEKLDTWKGHLYNWYNTRTLEALRPFYISTVDSGNYIGYMITLKQGLLEYLEKPIFDKNLLLGIKDLFDLIEETDRSGLYIKSLMDQEEIGINEWKKMIDTLNSNEYKESEWTEKLHYLLKELKTEINDFFIDVELKNEASKEVEEKLDKLQAEMSLVALNETYKDIIQTLDEEDEKNLIALKNNMIAKNNQVEEILNKVYDLIYRVDKIIDHTDFSQLYDETSGLFSIGYSISDEKLTNSYYDLFASEARLISYVAIARKQIPKKHWMRLGRSLSMIDGYRCLVSWTGTMFEYLMPPLVMKNYENTLLDETYFTVIKAQKRYGKSRNVPWGTSESGYYAFDMDLNYQYKAFGVPDVGLKRGLIKDMVVSPYSTVLALLFDIKGAMKNIRTLIDHGVEGKYGFYEAIDYTPERLPNKEKRAVIRSFMAHHQGMSFLAINNCLNDCIMQKRFHRDLMMKSAETLLQERVPERVIITKKYKEIVGPLETVKKEEVSVVRTFNHIGEDLPRCHMLSNGKYTVMITDSGCGYSKKEGIQVTRWRDDAITRKYGNFIFIKNLATNKIWSTTSDPIDCEPDGYEIKFSLDKAEFTRKDDHIDTHTEVVVSPEDHSEIRKVSLTNHGSESVVVEVTSYSEIILAHQAADVAHPAFSNLFIRTEMVSEYDSIIASRRPRIDEKNTVWMSHTITVSGETIGNLEYETNRANFIGRGRNIGSPVGLNKSLMNTIGPVLDPIMSLRRRIKIEPGNTVVVSYITSVSDSRKEVLDIAKKYYDMNSTSRAFNLAYTRSGVEMSYLNLKPEEVEVYQDMLPHIIFLSGNRRKNEELIRKNVKGQSGLWAYGISGDVPIVMVSIKSEDEIDLVKEALKAHEYWRIKGLHVDLVILNEDESNYLQPLQELIKETVFAKCGRDMMDRLGGIYVRDANIMPQEDKILLYTVARIVLKGDHGSIKGQLERQNHKELPKNRIFNQQKTSYISKEEPLDVDFYNEYGGFKKDGTEYIIRLRENLNTPAPWSNVIANRKFGFLVTENGLGYTWAENSRENKITPWSNDAVEDPSGEVIYVRDEETGSFWSMTPLPIREKESYTISHGFGYSVFKHDSHGMKQELCAFVPKDDPVKINLIHIKNNSDKERKLTITHFVKPVLGVTDQVTKPYIVTEMEEEKNTLYIRNVYNSDFPGRVAFTNSSEKMVSYTGDREEFIGKKGDLSNPESLRREGFSKNVGAGLDPCAVTQIMIELNPNEEKELVFLLGQGKNHDEADALVSKYMKVENCKVALKEAKDQWRNMLGTIQVKTPDLSMDLLVNNWLLYQTIACRLFARSAFYQSGGAYGYRDQLQDAMNAMHVLPEATRKQILIHCAHQFVEGDVQHWWHPGEVDKGIRTRFSDDLLWLPFVTALYIKHTGDHSVLNEEEYFLEDELLPEGEDERYGIPKISEEKASVYEHCIRAIERGLRFGEHDIPLMGSGDWNDGMNTVGNKGKGESIWLGWFLCEILNVFAEVVCKQMKDDERAERYIKVAKDIASSIEKNAWDGQWYKRAYFDDGTPLGSVENTECMIDSLAQSWSIISKGGSDIKTKEAMASVERYLVKKEDGMILLFTPPFDEGDLHPGYIKGYVPGVRENGGQYTHAATWVINAFAMMGDGDEAWALYNLINPVNHTRTLKECSIYKVEPYVMAADVYAVNPHTGRGGWTWYTGAAGWMYKVGLEYILGVRKEGDKLIINPCIPKNWPSYSIDYRFENTHYKVEVKNPKGVNCNVEYVVIDGERKIEKFIPLVDDQKEHKVEVFLG